jgi:hypothetical protein
MKNTISQEIDKKYADALFAGYKGSREEFKTILFDPNAIKVIPDRIKNRYSRAKEAGYKGSLEDFIKTLK